MMSRMYKKLPSEILRLKDDYTAYCFDEACSYIRARLDAGDEIERKKTYKSFTELYKDYK